MTIDKGSAVDALQGCSINNIKDQQVSFYQEAILSILRYFSLSDINTIIYVDSLPEGQLPEIKSVVKEAKNGLKVFEVKINTDFIEDEFDFKPVKKILLDSKEGVAEQVRVLDQKLN